MDPAVMIQRQVRKRDLLAVVALSVLAFWMASRIVGVTEPVETDATADWITVKAAFMKLDLFRDIHDLAEATGASYVSSGIEVFGDEDIVNPRTPGSLLLMSPVVVLEWDDAYFAVVGISMAAFLVLITYGLPRLCRVGVSELFVPILGVVVGLAYVQNFRWGTVSIPIALLVTLTWNRVRRRRSTGVALGVASALKLYPGAMAIPLVINRVTRRSGVVAAVTFVLLNIGGAAITGVSVAVSARMIQTGGSTWLAHPGNVSLPGVLSRTGLPLWVSYAVVASGVSALVAVSLKRPINQSIAFSLALAVVISPLSWPHYDVLVLPVLMILWCMRVDWKWAGPVVLTWILINAAAQARNFLFDFEYFNLLILVARLGLVAAVLAAPVTLWEESDPAPDPVPEQV
jgi:hypothetical protein